MADDLWGDFKHTGFTHIILPFLLLRRIESVPEPTREEVRKFYLAEKRSAIAPGLMLPEAVNQVPESIHLNYPTDSEQAFPVGTIHHLNELSGNASDEPGHQNFASDAITRVSQNPIVAEQVEKHEKPIALKDDLPQAVKQAVVQAMLKEGGIAQTLLKDPSVIASYVDLIFDMMKQSAAGLQENQHG